MERNVDNWCEQVKQEIVKLLAQSRAENFVEFIIAGSLLRSKLLGYLSNFDYCLINRAAVVELIHAASLLHDDVIDGSLLRRHFSTFWSEYGVKSAILLGDLLLSISFQQLISWRDFSSMEIIAKSVRELCDGELKQSLCMEKFSPELIAAGKTGSLFAAVASLSGNEGKLVRYELGMNVGIAYQLIDDLSDVVLGSSESGKSGNLDIVNGLTTAASWQDFEQLERIRFYLEQAKEKANLLGLGENFNRYLDEVFLVKAARVIDLGLF
ncbi:MAG: polyprenyl synthetase family protein [Lentisphaeria bacterium]